MVHHVDWLVLGVALYLTPSLEQASSPSVVDAEACENFEPKYGGALLHHVFQTLKVPSSIYCLRACDDDIRCQSINHVVHGEICELSNRTREAKPEDFTDDYTKVYMNKFRKRAAIGSLPEVPDESCNEVKTSEKGRNGKYWLSSIISGTPVFAYCDMKTGDADECTASPPVCHVNSLCTNTIGSYRCTCKRGYTGNGKICTDVNECTASTHNCGMHFKCINTPGSFWCAYNYSRESCRGIREDGKQRNVHLSDGQYKLSTNSTSLLAYCDMTSSGQAWTLIARFSNNDAKNWMRDNGKWWYDKSVGVGKGISPSVNADMLSPAFWLVSGLEFKITRSDDPHHTALLQTAGDCLGGQTFLQKIESYGNFRDGTVWASDDCQGNCSVQYGGQFQTTDGFGQAACSGSLQKATQVGFWCDWDGSGGAVLMIGGGGKDCQGADHGIAITEANQTSFLEKGQGEHDFDNDGDSYATNNKAYSLNLWIN